MSIVAVAAIMTVPIAMAATVVVAPIAMTTTVAPIITIAMMAPITALGQKQHGCCDEDHQESILLFHKSTLLSECEGHFLTLLIQTAALLIPYNLNLIPRSLEYKGRGRR